MLDALRSRASSWIVKLFLGILVLSFAIWGIGDIFVAPRGGNVVAEVDGLEITAPEVAPEFENELRRLREQVGGNIDRTHPLAAIALNAAVQRLVALRLLDAFAAEVGIGASDAEVAARIHDEPAFRGANGFDRQQLELFLRSVGMSERQYVEEVRREIVRGRILASLQQLAEAPEFLVRFLHDYRNATRTLDVLLVETASVQVDTPDEATLARYLEENQQRFVRPEYRRVVLAILGIEDILDEITVDEAEVRRLYEERKEGFRVPERRQVVQLLAPDEETAKLARERVAAGEDLQAVAADLAGRGVSFADLGLVSRTALPAAIAEAAFSLAQGEVSAPVKSPFGYHVLAVRTVEPEHVPVFEEKRAELEAQLRREKAARQLPSLATAFDDELAAGTRLEDAAQRFGAKLFALEVVDRNGLDPRGKPVLAEVLKPAMLEAIFAAKAGEASLLAETEDGRYWVFRVDAIEPERPLTLADGRDRILAVWQIERRREAAKALARSLLERLKAGESPEAVAATPGVRRQELGPVRRRSEETFGLPADVIARAFAVKEGEWLPDPVELSQGVAVVRVAKSEPAPALEEGQRAAIAHELQDGFEDDLLTQLEAALRQRYTVAIDERSLARFLEK